VGAAIEGKVEMTDERDIGLGRHESESQRDLTMVSPSELAALLDVPVTTVYRWRSRHEGPKGIRIGRHVRYRVEDVEAWLDTKARL